MNDSAVSICVLKDILIDPDFESASCRVARTGQQYVGICSLRHLRS